MIGVIADDLTGAAEIGAIGLRHGLRAEVVVWSAESAISSHGGEGWQETTPKILGAIRPETPTKERTPHPAPLPFRKGEGAHASQQQVHGQASVISEISADLVCLDTDSRSCEAEEAGRRVASAAQRLLAAGAMWIYKKVDSVLRGQVTAELEALLRELRLDLALLIPANPSLGRVIQGGNYFIRGKPIHETEFARDPEYPRTSSRVLELLTPPKNWLLTVCQVHDALPASGFVIGETASIADLQQWAARRAPGILPAGGADFFAALLVASAHHISPAPPSIKAPKATTKELFVCGSTSDSARDFIAAARHQGTPIFSLPEAAVRDPELDASAVEKIATGAAALFGSEQRVILNVGLPPVLDAIAAKRLSIHLVRLAERVLQRTEVGHIYAEGGATAKELVHRLGWTRLLVMQELAPGVATLVPTADRARRLTIKPGSYVWPREVRAV